MPHPEQGFRACLGIVRGARAGSVGAEFSALPADVRPTDVQCPHCVAEQSAAGSPEKICRFRSSVSRPPLVPSYRR
jgi:hypothetical protein